MTDGIVTSAYRPAGAGWGKRSFSALCGLLSYLALWGSLSSMAYLDTAGVLPLLAGGAVLLAAVLLPGRGWLLLPAAAAAGAVMCLAQPDGVRLLLNRLMTASMARQAYEYELFDLRVDDLAAAVRAALLPLGLLSGAVLGAAARCSLRPLFAAVFLAWAAAAAYLGVTPAVWWSVLFAVAAVLPFLRPRAASIGLVLAVVAAVTLLTLAAFPGEDAALSRWDETMRDRLAGATLAYSDAPQAGEPQDRGPQDAPEQRDFAAADTMDADEGGALSLPVPLPVLLIILAFALLLFLPSLLLDRVRKRRAKLRAGIDDADNAVAVRAMFLHALRWLREGGMTAENLPWSELADAVPEALRNGYREVIPLWQEAAYSTHPLTDAQRARMRAFLDETEAAVYRGLTRRQKLIARYCHAL